MSRCVRFTNRRLESRRPGPHFIDPGNFDPGNFGADLDITAVRRGEGQPLRGSGAPHP
jgi:hypothetical protein